MSDTTLNRFLASGTKAQRLAFTPAPATPASGPNPLCVWHETDTGDTYASDNGGAWTKVNTGSGGAGSIQLMLGMDGEPGEDGMSIVGPQGPAGGGGGGGSVPTIVQIVTSITNGVTVTFGSAPTAGNLLICMLTHWSTGVLVNTGWQQLLNTNGSDDGLFIGYKFCGGGESTTQQPINASASSNITMWEISGANIGSVGQLIYKGETNTAAQSLVFGVSGSNRLLIGMFCTTGSNSVPTITGVTGGTNITGTTASGSPRSLTPYSATPSSNTTVTATATYSGAVNQYAMGMLLNPA